MVRFRSLVLPFRNWSYLLVFCYVGWTLERVKIVDCKVSHLEFVKYDKDFCDINNSEINSVVARTENDNSKYNGTRSWTWDPEVRSTHNNEVTESTTTEDTAAENIRQIIEKKSWMSQFHVLSSFKVQNELCRNQSRILLDRAQEFELWALQMMDSSAKLPSGILNGNINQYGDFDQCLGVNVKLDADIYPELEDYHLKGKYCLASVDLDLRNSTSSILRNLDQFMFSQRPFISTVDDPAHRIARFSTISWGFCIPSSCTPQDLTSSLTEHLQFYLKDSEVALRVMVDPHMCYVQDYQPVSTGTKLTLAIFLSILVFVMIGTWIDNGEINAEEGKAVRILKAFSLWKNLKTLTDTNSIPNDIPSLHGIRALNALALIVFHKSAALFFNPFTNRTSMIKTFAMGWSVIGRTSIIYTDTFILISGLLTSHSILRELDKNKKINIWRKYLDRYVRFVPNMLAIILFCTYVMNHTGSGPQWNRVVKHHSDVCHKNMWRNLLFIHNYFGFENMCLTHTHQLAIDMQLFIIAPVFVYLLWRSRWLGLGLAAITAILSTLYRYHVTYSENLSTVLYFGATVSQLFRTASLSYILPTHRISVYIIGIVVGYLLHQTKSSVTLSKFQVAVGWIIAASMAVLSMFGPYHMSYPSYQYSSYEAALYNALSPVMWGVFIAWGIFAASNGYAGILGDFVSWRGFKTFSHISYAVYLTQFPIFFYNVGVRRIPEYYTPNLLFELGEVAVIIVASVVMTLMIDLPFQEVKRCFRNEGHRTAKKTNSIILQNDEHATLNQEKEINEGVKGNEMQRKCKSG